jgi:hypothetical protein
MLVLNDFQTEVNLKMIEFENLKMKKKLFFLPELHVDS